MKEGIIARREEGVGVGGYLGGGGRGGAVINVGSMGKVEGVLVNPTLLIIRTAFPPTTKRH